MNRTVGEQNTETRQAARNYDGMRREMCDMVLALRPLVRCDTGQIFELNLDAGEFVAAPYPPKPLSKTQTEALGLITRQVIVSDKPSLRIEISTLDSGDRKDFFGHTARHVITTRKQVPLEGSKANAQEMVTDGWYIDLDTSISCDQKRPSGKRTHAFLAVGSAPIEKIEFVDNGEPESGFAIEWKITTKETITPSEGTKKEQTFVQEMCVAQLIEGPLDPGLFTIPTGFRQAEHIDRDPPTDLPNQWSVTWNRFKTRLARLFR